MNNGACECFEVKKERKMLTRTSCSDGKRMEQIANVYNIDHEVLTYRENELPNADDVAMVLDSIVLDDVGMVLDSIVLFISRSMAASRKRFSGTHADAWSDVV